MSRIPCVRPRSRMSSLQDANASRSTRSRPSGNERPRRRSGSSGSSSSNSRTAAAASSVTQRQRTRVADAHPVERRELDHLRDRVRATSGDQRRLRPRHSAAAATWVSSRRGRAAQGARRHAHLEQHVERERRRQHGVDFQVGGGRQHAIHLLRAGRAVQRSLSSRFAKVSGVCAGASAAART